MISIRRNVFETNSSSTHSITMCSEDEYKKWQNGELLLHIWNEEFSTKEDIINKAKEKQKEYLDKQAKGELIRSWEKKYILAKTDEELYEIEEDDGYKSYDEYWNWCEHETFDTSYTTKNGEKICAFGYFGFDG